MKMVSRCLRHRCPRSLHLQRQKARILRLASRTGSHEERLRLGLGPYAELRRIRLVRVRITRAYQSWVTMVAVVLAIAQRPSGGRCPWSTQVCQPVLHQLGQQLHHQECSIRKRLYSTNVKEGIRCLGGIRCHVPAPATRNGRGVKGLGSVYGVGWLTASIVDAPSLCN